MDQIMDRDMARHNMAKARRLALWQTEPGTTELLLLAMIAPNTEATKHGCYQRTHAAQDQALHLLKE